MSVVPAPTVTLASSFASDLPELALEWQAAETPAPRILELNEPVARELGLDPAWLRTADGIGFLTGTSPAAGSRPVAQVYAGHQFGGFSPRLGDGRALLLGELETVSGEQRDLHLKGSGRTPLSRGGDGLAVVGPMLREYVVSEAMHHLGIPTTRSLAVVATGRRVMRETAQPGALLTRVARSHLRVGSFQYAAATGDVVLLRRLADHAIARHYPAATAEESPYLALYRSVVSAQAHLVARWMLVGFVHGVMNTDNVTISGETIDYGPCAFLDAYDPATVFSSIDEGGRYAYGNQPPIMEWNLARLAEALLPLLGEDQDAAVAAVVEVLGEFRVAYAAAWSDGMRAKLGLPADLDDGLVGELVNDLLRLMHEGRVDWTSLFRALSGGTARDLFLDVAGFDAWAARWSALGPDPVAMDLVNPAYIARNQLLEEALAAATDGDLAPLDRLVGVLADPFVVRPGLERYAEPGPLDSDFRTFCGT